MFENGKRTIGVFVNRPELDFQREFMKSLIKASTAKDFNIAFMTSYGVRNFNNCYDAYESSIVDFAPIEEFDAIVVPMDTYDTKEFRKTLIDGLKNRAKCPIISYREETDDYYNVLSDANDSIEQIVNHIINVHGAKNICFMGGYEGHYDAQVRLNLFLKCAEKYNIPLYDNSIFYGDMWKGKGEEAYRSFFSNPDNKPDAIICANDFMARALCDAVLEHGLRIPEDVIITGFDHASEAIGYEPRITTVSVNFEKMAYETVDLICDLLNNKTRDKNVYVPSKVIYYESCGCTPDGSMADGETTYNHYRNTTEFIDKHTKQRFFSIDMDECRTMEDIEKTVSDNINLVGDYNEFYLCLFDDEIGGLSDLKGKIDVELKLGFKNGKRIDVEKLRFNQKELIPSELCDDGQKIYYFRILHDKDKNFGYSVISFKNQCEFLDIFYNDWNLTISLALKEYFIEKQLANLIKLNHENSIKDFLTQLYNRRGLESYVDANWNQWVNEHKKVAFLSVDLDGLKVINDNYGHIEGDYAIVTIANILRDVIKNKGFVSRVGGDEFLAIILDAKDEVVNDIEKKIDDSLINVNDQNKKEFRVDCSVGKYITVLSETSEYDECIKMCDFEMYNNKKAKKVRKL